MPWGGGVKNVGLKDICHILNLLSPGASMFHKHMTSFVSDTHSERYSLRSPANLTNVQIIIKVDVQGDLQLTQDYSQGPL